MTGINAFKMITKKVTSTVIDSEATGARCKYHRTVSGITLREMSDEMGISVTYLSNLEHGRREWNPLLLSKANVALLTLRSRLAAGRHERQSERSHKNAKGKAERD